MRVMELPNWPPDAGGPFDPHNHRFPVSADEVLIERVLSVHERHVAFTCTLNVTPHEYDFFAPDNEIARKLEAILTTNVGKKLSSIGTMQIPE
jgi:hypothetical protein